MVFDHPSQTYWTAPRLELRAWFQRNAPSLGELYVGALWMLFDSKFPGRTRFVAHAVREIRNRLPDVIAGSKSGVYFDWKTRLDGLAKEWQKTGFTLDGSNPMNVTHDQGVPVPTVSVEPRLFRKIAVLLKDHVDAREKPEEAAIRLFEGVAPVNQNLRDTLRPVVIQWLDVTEWFMKKAHDSGAPDNEVDEQELISRFQIFEIFLGALLRDFFMTVEGLDEILEDANS